MLNKNRKSGKENIYTIGKKDFLIEILNWGKIVSKSIRNWKKSSIIVKVYKTSIIRENKEIKKKELKWARKSKQEREILLW